MKQRIRLIQPVRRSHTYEANTVLHTGLHTGGPQARWMTDLSIAKNNIDNTCQRAALHRRPASRAFSVRDDARSASTHARVTAHNEFSAAQRCAECRHTNLSPRDGAYAAKPLPPWCGRARLVHCRSEVSATASRRTDARTANGQRPAEASLVVVVRPLVIFFESLPGHYSTSLSSSAGTGELHPARAPNSRTPNPSKRIRPPALSCFQVVGMPWPTATTRAQDEI